MPADIPPADTLDAIGLLCPEPLFQARTAIDELEPGEVLEVLADDAGEVAGKRVLVLGKGPATAKLALELTKFTPRVIFLTELDVLGFPAELANEIKRSDVKVLYRSRLLSVGGEGEVEKVRVHDLDEENDYDLFVDAVVLLEV